MRLKNEMERLIYAAAYVRHFADDHARGLHANWRGKPDGVRLWEEECADNAIEEANGLVRLHRNGVRQRKERGCE